MEDLYLIFTATVRPNRAATFASQVSADEQVRENEYIRAITANVKLARKAGLPVHIIVGENSSAPATRLQEVCRELGVQWVRCKELPASEFKGKGQGEALLIDEVMRSLPSDTAPENRRFVKVTGRLVVTNLDKVLQVVATTKSDALAALFVRATYADTRVLAFTARFWPLLMARVPQIDDEAEVFIEHIVPEAMKESASLGRECGYLVPPPRISGQSASMGVRYRDSVLLHSWIWFKLVIYQFIHPI